MKTRTIWGITVLLLALACVPVAFAGTSAASHPAKSAKAQASQDMAGYRNWSTQKMRHVQEALISHGAKIKASGHWNDETRAAIKAFQKKHGLNVTGFPNRKTVAKLEAKSPK